jgi:hypothetical protein
MSDLSQDNANGFCPDERFRIFIVYTYVLFNGRHQIRYAAEHATPNTFAGDLPKPPFNEIEP